MHNRVPSRKLDFKGIARWRPFVNRVVHFTKRLQEALMAKSGSSSKSSSNKGGHYRSAITGRYVTAKHGRANPNTTVREG